MKDLQTDDKIKHLLNLEPHLTGHQISRIIQNHEGGQFGTIYQRVMKTLERMAVKKEVKKLTRGMGNSYLWMLKEAGLPRGNYEHLRDCADLFCALFPHQELWEWERQFKKFRPDRTARINGRLIYFEVDRGTEKVEKLKAKLGNYITLFRETREPFSVIFTLQDYVDPFSQTQTSAKARGQKLIDLFEELHLPATYLVCFHHQVIERPINAPIVSRFDQHTLLELP